MKDTYQELIKDFPSEALSKDSSRGFDLTSIKAQYIKERLNDVFGIWGWEVVGEYKADEKSVLYFGELRVTEKTYLLANNSEDATPAEVDSFTRKVESVGYSAIKKNLGDSYKSAQTDFLSKAASFIGVGQKVFQGLVNPNSYKTPTKQPQKTSPQAQKQPNKSDSDITDPGQWIVPFGKFKGKKIEQLSDIDADNYIDFLERSAKDKGKKIEGVAAVFIDCCERYFSQQNLKI